MLFGSAAIALLTTFTTEAVLVYQKTQGTEIEKKAALNADKLKSAEAEIVRLKTAIAAQFADDTEKMRKAEDETAANLKKAEEEIAALKAQLDSQIAINAELSKTAEESKRRAQAAAQAFAKLRRAPVAPPPPPQAKSP